MTHVKRLEGIAESVQRFFAALEPLAESGRLGPVLWQLPENFHRDDGRLAGLLDLGYVAFFAVGAYSWAIFGSPHGNVIFGGGFPIKLADQIVGAIGVSGGASLHVSGLCDVPLAELAQAWTLPLRELYA